MCVMFRSFCYHMKGNLQFDIGLFFTSQHLVLVSSFGTRIILIKYKVVLKSMMEVNRG